MTNKKMWAIIVALIVVVAIVAIATGVFSKPPEEAEISPPISTGYVDEEKEDEPDVEGTGVEDDVNMGSLPGSGQGNEDMSKLPKEEQDRIKAQHEAEQAKAEETPTETQQPTTPPSQPSGPSGTAGTAMHNGSTVRAFNSVSDLNGLKPIKPFETVMVNGTPYGWDGMEWFDATANMTVGGGSIVIEGGLSDELVGY